MNRLIVQHPKLAARTVEVFSKVLLQAPDRQTPTLAHWQHVAIDELQLARLAESQQVDAELVPTSDPLSSYRLIACDMDSTLITVECIDEIADFAGKKDQVAQITAAAMRGELDFAASLRQRVALLAGLDADVLNRVFEERVRLSDGAEQLIGAAHRAGLQSLIASGGFSYFAERLAKRLGIGHIRANELQVRNGKLTGQVLGQIVDAQVKQDAVLKLCHQIGCDRAQTIVIGDGANDLKMMAVAGVSIAFHAKPIVRHETTRSLNHCGLDAALNFFS